jgi:hypothetical protein
MHTGTTTALIVTALAASILLLLGRGDRLYAGLAVIVAGVETLMVFDVLRLSISGVRIDVILAGLLAVAGALCWSKSTAKWPITASTLIALVGLIQLLVGLRVLR